MLVISPRLSLKVVTSPESAHDMVTCFKLHDATLYEYSERVASWLCEKVTDSRCGSGLCQEKSLCTQLMSHRDGNRFIRGGNRGGSKKLDSKSLYRTFDTVNHLSSQNTPRLGQGFI